MEKYMIYSDIEFLEHEAYFREQYPHMEYEEIRDMTSEHLAQDFNSLQTEFDKPVAHSIIAIADVGRWNGRFMGYNEIESGNLKDCFQTGRDIDVAEWFVDKQGDLRSEQHHHDGRHYVLYRGIKGENAYEDIEHFKHLIYTGKATAHDIGRYTERIGDVIAKHYGWEIETPTRKPSLRETLAANAQKSREMFGNMTASTPEKARGEMSL